MTEDPLFQPFQIGDLTIRNRLVSISHEPAYSELGMPTDRYRRYHVEKARGGIGMTMIGGSAIVSKDSPAIFGNIDMSTDEVIPWLRLISDDVHAEGVAVMTQLTHLGWRATNFQGDWLPVIGPSRVRETLHRSFTKEMEDFDMDRVVADFAAAAKRIADGGLDGLELMHWGHLLDMFVVDRLNHRDDEWGGAFENQQRFVLRVIDAVRAAVPDDFVVGIKMSVDDFTVGGMEEARAIELINAYANHGIQFLNLAVGTIDTEATIAKHIPGIGTPAAPFLDHARRIRERIRIPVLHGNRITDIETARYALESGAADLVGMVRATIADPYLPLKAKEGREEDIRPCVGANTCLDGIYSSGSSICIHNPASGREGRLPHVITAVAESKRKKVVIVGAGPAGLEAARVCAERGHRVVVFEAAERHGGQVCIAARSERRRDLIGIVDWRLDQAKKKGAEFRFNTYAEQHAVLAEGPDFVIVATGGLPDTDLPSLGAPVYDVRDVIQDRVRGKHRVLIFDDNGSYPAFEAAERLGSQGHEVVFATPDRTLAAQIGEMNASAYMHAFSVYGIAAMLSQRLIATAQETSGGVVATLRNEFSAIETQLVVDAVVVERGTIPNDELYFELKPRSKNLGEVDYEAFVRGGRQDRLLEKNPQGEFQLARIGDAVNSRNMHAAILDALRLSLGV
ncbi:MAG TPA: FAD-dependent oxidoreductase [Candidatus Agrococcus pullicola]|uniref:FAD-dependent oxidoreductase n=1 Tax=Candidatus Agrococcus pullicola TaxID=2838429 RepID=A0A9D1YY60_9MICO|nr:FAD-dependent oxidoreductase [Candidatus Agrococcus pullicola]